MATLRNNRNLAAVSRGTPQNTRSSQSQNTLDPELAQEYISQVSEKIEERVTKNFSKEFSRTSSRILGANNYIGAEYTSRSLIDFDWYNADQYQY